jgi:hypothetical protein
MSKLMILKQKEVAFVSKDGVKLESTCYAGHVAHYPQKLALTSSTSGSRSVRIVRSRTKATE